MSNSGQGQFHFYTIYFLSTTYTKLNTNSSPVDSGSFCPKFSGTNFWFCFARLQVFLLRCMILCIGYYTPKHTLSQFLGQNQKEKNENPN
jgi:hypothetical protein